MRLVGSFEEQVVEESRETIDAQMDALIEGRIPAVMFPSGSRYVPTLPAGFSIAKVSGPGSGIFYFDPAKLTESVIRLAAFDGNHGALLGHLQRKDSIGWNGIVVCAVLPSGVTVQESVVSATNEAMIEAQKRVMARRHPGAEIVTMNPARVLAMRAAESS